MAVLLGLLAGAAVGVVVAVVVVRAVRRDAVAAQAADEAARQQAVAEAVARERDLRIVPLAEAWDARAAQVATADGRFLLVDPDRHGTDGFFAAVLQRAV